MGAGAERGRGVPCSVTASGDRAGPRDRPPCPSGGPDSFAKLVHGYGVPLAVPWRRTPLSNRTLSRAAQGRAAHRTRGNQP